MSPKGNAAQAAGLGPHDLDLDGRKSHRQRSYLQGWHQSAAAQAAGPLEAPASQSAITQRLHFQEQSRSMPQFKAAQAAGCPGPPLYRAQEENALHMRACQGWHAALASLVLCITPQSAAREHPEHAQAAKGSHEAAQAGASATASLLSNPRRSPLQLLPTLLALRRRPLAALQLRTPEIPIRAQSWQGDDARIISSRSTKPQRQPWQPGCSSWPQPASCAPSCMHQKLRADHNEDCRELRPGHLLSGAVILRAVYGACGSPCPHYRRRASCAPALRTPKTLQTCSEHYECRAGLALASNASIAASGSRHLGAAGTGAAGDAQPAIAARPLQGMRHLPGKCLIDAVQGQIQCMPCCQCRALPH